MLEFNRGTMVLSSNSHIYFYSEKKLIGENGSFSIPIQTRWSITEKNLSLVELSIQKRSVCERVSV